MQLAFVRNCIRKFESRIVIFLKSFGREMGRWLKPEAYPLIAAMTFVTGICVFSLTRHVVMNPDVRINKVNRSTAILDNAEEGEKYSQHGFRKFLSNRRPEVMPSLNSFFSKSDK